MSKFSFTSALVLIAICITPLTASMHPESREKAIFPASYELFSSKFKQPEPPLVQSEFKANWKQHAWSPHYSHIASGYFYHSPTQQKVRVDAAHSSTFSSSLFDYTNRSATGLVANTQYTLEPSVSSEPRIFHGYVKPSFPLFADDLLVQEGAVFAGVVEDRDMGSVVSWNFMYQGSMPVTVYLDGGNVVTGYDFFDTSTRSRIVNRYFNIDVGKLDGRLFDFPK